MSQLKLWGKIKGTEKDYYVVEGTLDAGEAAEGEEQAEGFEPRGSGVNKFVYYVCNGPLDKWIQLPDLKPQDIINARSIKFHFSGDVDRSICTNPFFFGTEKIYLRAQIARISMSTSIVPKSLFRLQEENKREIEDNAPEEGDIVKPSVSEMTDISKWAHYQPSILLQGKVTHKEGKPLDGEEEVEPEVLLAREVAKDPWEDRLKPIVLDKNTLGNMPAWVLRSYNAHESFKDPKT